MTLVLSEHHRLTLAAISDAIIVERGYTTIPSAIAFEADYAGLSYEGLWARRTLKRIFEHGPALLIPIYPTCQPSQACVLRPDSPRLFEDGRSPKYEQPAKVKPVLDILPRYRQSLADVSIPLWITEGAKKADALATLFDMEIVPASINGVNGWSSGGMLGDFDQLQIKWRQVVIVPDGDIQSNVNVAKAVDRLAHALERRGAAVSLALLPDGTRNKKVGVDDYINEGHDKADIQSLILPWVQAVALIAQSLKDHGHGTGASIEQMIDQWAAERDAWAYDVNRDLFFAWKETHWEQARAIDVDQKCVELLKDAGRDTKGSAVNDIQRFVKPKLARGFVLGEGLANFQNGTYGAAIGQLRPHSRDDGLLYCLPFDFLTTAPMPTTQAFLEQTIPDPIARVCYMVFVGLAILGDTTRENFLTLIGATRSGKSTLLGLAQYVTGNTESPRSFAGASLLSDETEGKRARYQWINHRMVAIDELKSEVMMKAEEKIKILSAHGGAEMRGMNKDESTRNRWTPKLIMASNDAPRFMDNSGALQARMRVIRCPNSRLGAEDFNLFSKLIAEAGTFASVCTGLAAGILFHGLPLPEGPAMREAKDELGQQNPLKAFVADEGILGPDERCGQKEFRAAYLDYCMEHGYKPMGDGRLFAALKDCGYAIDNKGWLHAGRAYTGIRLRTINDLRQHTANTANTLPTHFIDSVGAVLGDWEALKRTSANTANTLLENSINVFTPCMYAHLACLHTYMDPLRESKNPLSVLAVLADDVLEHQEAIKSAYTSANTTFPSVGSVGSVGTLPPAALAAYEAGTIRSWCQTEGRDYDATLDLILAIRKQQRTVTR